MFTPHSLAEIYDLSNVDIEIEIKNWILSVHYPSIVEGSMSRVSLVSVLIFRFSNIWKISSL